MKLRNMTESDLPQVLELQRELAFQDWNEKQFLSEIRASYAYCVVCEDEAKLLGYAIFHLLGPDSELLSIATRSSEQRKGIGSQLLKAGLDKLTESGDQCFLEVRNGNAKARAFYEKHGFKLYSVRKKYYSDGEDAALYKFSR
ncbi:ribosomal-protein-alanine N-acetyltransferase [Fibrobacter sp. UWB16]|uniref:ribosomal protein S18-alanine N-acetyltransferase n=1 Tax=unclassified Fibrobacter TaxID=2634177 RepID=UPI000B520784|nr:MULTISPECIES: ribosomal protein S18-alanine N-acetyltransferase [unclassified Fibrobacter]OWV22771.1 ribosomal-protein-alanine N-acetyltransferase [Fibrobacter sp. UWB3]SOD13983.1 ribosomal-protein-alanine N-acetyltransferase [Fibrobacter sp. UWB16]